MTIDRLKEENEQLKKDILYFKRLYEAKLHETSDWIKTALSRQNVIDELGGKLSKNDDNKNKALQEKLDIAIKALEKYARRNDWYNCRDEKTEDIYYNSGYFLNGYETAQEALAKIKEIK